MIFLDYIFVLVQRIKVRVTESMRSLALYEVVFLYHMK